MDGSSPDYKKLFFEAQRTAQKADRTAQEEVQRRQEAERATQEAERATQEEAKRLREYLLRGGFLMVDDFWSQEEWQNFRDGMAQVLPGQSIDDIALTGPSGVSA